MCGNAIVHRALRFLLVPAIALGTMLVSTAPAAGQSTTLVSVDSAGRQRPIYPDSAISADGRFVAFTAADPFEEDDTNGRIDVFVHDRLMRTTERVSRGQNGQGNGNSYRPAISENGRFVAFTSLASNLTFAEDDPVDSNFCSDIFVRDRMTGTTRRVSVTYVAEFRWEFLRARLVWRLVEANGCSDFASISADGRFVAFESRASNLVPGDTNGASDIFVRDQRTRSNAAIVRKSVGALVQANGDSMYARISSNGRVVSFSSIASNLDLGDSNGTWDVFVNDAGVIERVSVNTSGTEGNAGSVFSSLNADGRFVVFESYASNIDESDTNGLTDIFVRDRVRHVTQLASVGADGRPSDGYSYDPSISASGRLVVFASSVTNLDSTGVAANTGFINVFMRDLIAGSTQLVSVRSDGIPGNGFSSYSEVSSDGRTVAFVSTATNLLDGIDGNDSVGIFVHDLRHEPGQLVSWGANSSGQLGTGSLSATFVSTPQSVLTSNLFRAVSGGRAHTLGITSDGSVFAWGDNSAGQLGNNSFTRSLTPGDVLGFTGAGRRASAIAAGHGHSLALTSSSDVYAWGSNFTGQLGDGTVVDRSMPVRVPLSGIARIAANGTHSLALNGAGEVFYWGDRSDCFVNEVFNSRPAPERIEGLEHIVEITAGCDHDLALAADGTVWAWGSNRWGQLGDGTFTSREIPARVNGLTNVVAIAAGYGRSIALTSDGALWVWGQLPNNVKRSTPGPVAGVGNASAVSDYGLNVALAVKDDETVWQFPDWASPSVTTVSAMPTGIGRAIATGSGENHHMVIRRPTP